MPVHRDGFGYASPRSLRTSRKSCAHLVSSVKLHEGKPVTAAARNELKLRGVAERLRINLVGVDGACPDHSRIMRRPWGQNGFGSCVVPICTLLRCLHVFMLSACYLHVICISLSLTKPPGWQMPKPYKAHAAAAWPMALARHRLSMEASGIAGQHYARALIRSPQARRFPASIQA